MVASGVVLAHAAEALATDPDLEKNIALFQVKMPYPLKVETVAEIIAGFDQVLFLEETQPVMEMQLAGLVGRDLIGRRTGFWPDAGEMSPDVVYDGLRRLAGLETPPGNQGRLARPASDALRGLPPPGRFLRPQ